jgi:hypothetical protein
MDVSMVLYLPPARYPVTPESRNKHRLACALHHQFCCSAANRQMHVRSLSRRGFFNLLTPALPRREKTDSREPIPRTTARIRPRDDLFSAVLIGP